MAISEMAMQPLWLDVSKWQGQINYTALSQVDGYDKVYGIFSRAGWGENGGYIDQYFERNWSKSKQFGLYRASYYAFWPYYPMMKQLDDWYSTNPTIDLIPRMIDLERGDAPFKFIAEQTLLMSDKILERDGVRPIIYSRVDLLEDWITPFWSVDEVNAHYYLLAQYDLGDGKEYNGIVVPDKVEPKNILWKQTTSKMEIYNGSGFVDRDRWIWTDVETMHEQIQSMWGTEEPPTPPTTPDCCEELTARMDSAESKLNTLRTDVDSVEIRSNDNHTRLGSTRIELGELTERVIDIETKQTQLERAIGNQASNISKIETDVSEIKSQISELTTLIEETNTGLDESLTEINVEIKNIKTKLGLWNLIRSLFNK